MKNEINIATKKAIDGFKKAYNKVSKNLPKSPFKTDFSDENKQTIKQLQTFFDDTKKAKRNEHIEKWIIGCVSGSVCAIVSHFLSKCF